MSQKQSKIYDEESLLMKIGNHIDFSIRKNKEALKQSELNRDVSSQAQMKIMDAKIRSLIETVEENFTELIKSTIAQLEQQQRIIQQQSIQINGIMKFLTANDTADKTRPRSRPNQRKRQQIKNKKMEQRQKMEITELETNPEVLKL